MEGTGEVGGGRRRHARGVRRAAGPPARPRATAAGPGRRPAAGRPSRGRRWRLFRRGDGQGAKEPARSKWRISLGWREEGAKSRTRALSPRAARARRPAVPTARSVAWAGTLSRTPAAPTQAVRLEQATAPARGVSLKQAAKPSRGAPRPAPTYPAAHARANPRTGRSRPAAARSGPGTSTGSTTRATAATAPPRRRLRRVRAALGPANGTPKPLRRYSQPPFWQQHANMSWS